MGCHSDDLESYVSNSGDLIVPGSKVILLNIDLSEFSKRVYTVDQILTIKKMREIDGVVDYRFDPIEREAQNRYSWVIKTLGIINEFQEEPFNI